MALTGISANQEEQFRILSVVWMLFSIWAVILQTLLQKRIVKITSWNLSPGWQREIGLWNVGAVALISLHLLQRAPVSPILIPVLLVWSGLFGTNHLVGYLKDRKAKGHFGGFLMNLLPFVWSASIFLFVP